MSLILNIDTSMDLASVCLAKDGVPLQLSTNGIPKAHASWLQTAIVEMMQSTGHILPDLNAVAVSIGPGSYTGLRVALASAKGFCYALKIPLIAVGTLEMMAFAVKGDATDLICPMIDARRMEVFTALYDLEMNEKMAPAALIIDQESFHSVLQDHDILFCGNGRKKLQTVASLPRARYSDQGSDASHLGILSWEKFQQENFAQLAYTEPFYGKEFYSTAAVTPPK